MVLFTFNFTFSEVKNVIPIFAFLIGLALLSCTKKGNPLNAYNNNDLAGTKWVLYQYKDVTTTTPLTRSDTLIFSSGNNYAYNGQTLNYYLDYNTYTHLTLGGTPFGDLDGTVPDNFITNKEIINTPFSQLKPSGALTYYLWLKRIN